jgi:hypothetical protein
MYCGTCGTYYSPQCPHRESGGCLPCPDPSSVLFAQAVAALAQVAGMTAENQHHVLVYNSVRYGLIDFQAIAETLLREAGKAPPDDETDKTADRAAAVRTDRVDADAAAVLAALAAQRSAARRAESSFAAMLRVALRYVRKRSTEKS